MFTRKKKNTSGSTSVQIIYKKSGKYKVVQTIGSSKNQGEVERFLEKGQEIIQNNFGKQQQLISFKTKDDFTVESFLNNLSNSQVRTIGPELIFGALFDRIGFNVIKNDLFRYITIARLAYPTSKLKTVDYLYRYRGIKINVDQIYNFLDKLNNRPVAK